MKQTSDDQNKSHQWLHYPTTLSRQHFIRFTNSRSEIDDNHVHYQLPDRDLHKHTKSCKMLLAVLISVHVQILLYSFYDLLILCFYAQFYFSISIHVFQYLVVKCLTSHNTEVQINTVGIEFINKCGFWNQQDVKLKFYWIQITGKLTMSYFS